MDWSADHVDFVIAAYAIVAVVLVGLLLQILFNAKRLKQQLKHLKLGEPGTGDTQS
jgi:heme exporter protein CcmD